MKTESPPFFRPGSQSAACDYLATRTVNCKTGWKLCNYFASAHQEEILHFFVVSPLKRRALLGQGNGRYSSDSSNGKMV